MSKDKMNRRGAENAEITQRESFTQTTLCFFGLELVLFVAL